jgi:hypothetical protein
VYTAPVVAAGLDDDPPWLATAYVPGLSLADVVARHGALPEVAVWRLAAGLAEALRAVHACGLVHRDLKPANVLLASDGPHVIDFGISRAFDGTALTAVGMVVGTPGYMSPEQAEGDQVGTASDVFSLGCVLAFTASGNAPFGAGSAASVLYRVVTGQPDLALVPERLREVISACLAKSPSQRPDLATLGAMITRVGPAVAATPTSFWPAQVAEVIRESAACPAAPKPAAAATAAAATGAAAPVSVGPAGMVQDGYYAAATASMAAPRPDPLARYTPAARRPWRPTSVVTAVWLMYGGAALTALGMIIDLIVISQLRVAYLRNHPFLDQAGTDRINTIAGAGDLGVIIGFVIGISLWIALAAAAGSGHGWTRTAGTVLFGIDTLVFIATAGRPGIPAIKTIHSLIWLAGLLAVIFLWQRTSGQYFSARRRR